MLMAIASHVLEHRRCKIDSQRFSVVTEHTATPKIRKALAAGMAEYVDDCSDCGASDFQIDGQILKSLAAAE